MTAKRSDPPVRDDQPQRRRGGSSRAAEIPHLAFRKAPPTFQIASASAPPRRPLLFVHADAAGGIPKAKKLKREIRSHVMLNANENKRRGQAGVHKNADKENRETATVAELRLAQQTIWGIGTGEMDRFGTLPMQETPFYRNIVDFFFHDMPNQIPYNDGQSIRVYGTMRGSRVSPEIISWEQEACRLIREWLASGSPNISDSISCAIGTLALCAINEGFYEVADVHFNGMLTIISARGGLDTFEPFTQRGLTWCEFHYRMYHMTVPVLHRELSPADLEMWRESFPLELRHQATIRHHRGQLRLPSIGADLDVVLFHLHHLSIAQDLQRPAQTIRIIMRHILYDSEYKLLVILAKLRVDDEGDVHASTELSAAKKVRSAVAQAAQLFLLAALSEMPLRKALYDLLVERLKTTLSSFNAIDQWTQVAHLHSLVWVLFVGWTLASKCADAPSSQMWFRKRLTVVMWELELSLDALEELLSQFPLTDAFFREPYPWTTALS